MQAVALDLFDTLIRCDPTLLPQIDVNGRSLPSTLGEVAGVLAEAGHAVPLEQLLDKTRRVSVEQEAEKRRSGREFPSSYRWSTVLAELGVEPEMGLVHRVVERHMTLLCASAVMAPDDRLAVQRLFERFPLALLSNFDHGPSARSLLDRLELTDVFQYIGISDELGWRKPHPRVFEALLAGLGVGPEDCLYVGDNVECDVIGAQSLGIAAAWIAKPDTAFPDDVPPPAYRAASIAALEPQLAAAPAHEPR